MFVAADPPPGWIRSLAALGGAVGDLDHRWRRARWVPAENLHLTLRFLGEIEDGLVSSLTSDLQSACRELPAFELPLHTLIRPVRSARRATLLWTEFEDPDRACADLVSRISRVALDHGVGPDSRGFTPHITLARTRVPLTLTPAVVEAATSTAGIIGDDPRPSMSVRTVTVYTSRLTPAGAVYSRKASVDLIGD